MEQQGSYDAAGGGIDDDDLAALSGGGNGCGFLTGEPWCDEPADINARSCHRGWTGGGHWSRRRCGELGSGNGIELEEFSGVFEGDVGGVAVRRERDSEGAGAVRQGDDVTSARVSWLMMESVALKALVIQIRPSGAMATQRGEVPTGISASFARVTASMTVTLSLSGFTTQTRSFPELGVHGGSRTSRRVGRWSAGHGWLDRNCGSPYCRNRRWR